MNINNLSRILSDYPAFRIKQANEAVFKQLVESWDEASNLPQEIKKILTKKCPLAIKHAFTLSEDEQTVKAAITLEDGAVIETVLLSHQDGRRTVCLSSQVGCPLACTFCLTGQTGFARNLTAEEIIEQVLLFARHLKKQGEKISNVVFMGMGEPLLNYDEVMKAIKFINHPHGFNLGARHISISTIGIIEGINKLANESLPVNLAVSVHAADKKLREKLMPASRNQPLDKVLTAVNLYLQKTNRRVMIEYLMLNKVNDSLNDAKLLAEVLKKYLGQLFFVNLITYNPGGGYKPSSSKRIQVFQAVLKTNGVSAIRRYSFGLKIKGACGQLAVRTV